MSKLQDFIEVTVFPVKSRFHIAATANIEAGARVREGDQKHIDDVVLGLLREMNDRVYGELRDRLYNLAQETSDEETQKGLIEAMGMISIDRNHPSLKSVID